MSKTPYVNKEDKGYSDNFFKRHYPATVTAMESIIPILEQSGLFGDPARIYSAVDFGCGLGGSLEALVRNGTEVVLGVDGWWVNPEHVVIEDFLHLDINQRVDLGQIFGLVICLEVAEHLPPESALVLVENLVQHGARILFSGAIPGQGGHGHVNEQWPEYWAELFAAYDYYPVDIIREPLWNNLEVQFWYIQNTLMYVSKKKLRDMNLMHLVTDKVQRRVHPQCRVKL